MICLEKLFDVIINDQYGIVFGGKKLIFLKTGRGGSIYGHENKYVKLAKNISEQFGYSVVISAYSEKSVCMLKEELNLIKSYIVDLEEILFVGISAGALIGAQQGYLNNEITGMLLVNGPIMINWPKTKKGIERFEGKFVEMIYGTEDPSYRYFEILNCIKSEILNFKEIKGADHNFSGMQDTLESEIIRFINFLI